MPREGVVATMRVSGGREVQGWGVEVDMETVPGWRSERQPRIRPSKGL